MKDNKKPNSEQKPEHFVSLSADCASQVKSNSSNGAGTKTLNFKYQTSNQHLIFAEIFSI